MINFYLRNCHPCITLLSDSSFLPRVTTLPDYSPPLFLPRQCRPPRRQPSSPATPSPPSLTSAPPSLICPHFPTSKSTRAATSLPGSLIATGHAAVLRRRRPAIGLPPSYSTLSDRIPQVWTTQRPHLCWFAGSSSPVLGSAAAADQSLLDRAGVLLHLSRQCGSLTEFSRSPFLLAVSLTQPPSAVFSG